MTIANIDNAESGSSVRTKLNSVIAATNAAREVLTANRTYYVRTDGSDSNNGLADTSGGAFLTIQKAIDVVKILDLAGQSVTIKCTGNFTSQGQIDVLMPIGAGDVILQGDTSDLTATKIKALYMDSQKPLARFILDAVEFVNGDAESSSFKLDNSTAYHGRISYNSRAYPINISANSALFPWATNCSISLTPNVGVSVLGICSNSSLLMLQGMSGSIVLNSSPAFALAQWYCEGNSFINIGGTTITGSFTGTQYTVGASSSSTIRLPDFSYLTA